MAINQNRNSIRVLRTAGGSYLAHKNIPNLSIGTGGDFTIQLWVVTGGDMDGVLYSQEGGFSIQLVDGQAVFSLDGFATLRPEDGWTLAPHTRSYIAVRYQAGTLTLFLGGLPAAEQTVSAKATPCTGDYTIGKHFTGGFPLIRVSDTARSDRDILADNAAPPAVDGHCVFQSDCSTAQYRDVSANHLSMWSEGREAGCGIYTACTVFSGKGQVSCTPLESLSAAHTLLLKLWPQPQQRPVQRVYTAMDGGKTLYAVELAAQADHTFQLSLISGGGKATLSKALLPELWQDVAAVFEGGKVKLYLDGAPDGEYSFSCSGARSDVLVGSEYETGKPRYEKGFSGYIAYTAEFNQALSAAEIALYADDPPFLFEDGLVSLLPLDWPDAVEAIGVTPLRVTGSAPFNMVPDTTPQGGDIGCSMRVPTEVSPYWNQLSADEQWALELLTTLLQEEFTALCGYPGASKAGEDIPVYQRIPRHIIRNNEPEWTRLRELSPDSFSGEEITESLMPELEARGNAPISGALGGVGGITAAGAAGAAGSASANAGAIIAGTAIGAVVAAIVAAIVIAEKKRPGSNGELKVTAICWNHRGDPARGGLHYHSGGADLPASMVDVPGPTQIDTLCVLVPSRLTAPTLDVTLTYTTAGTKPKTGTLKGCDVRGSALLGERSVAYTVAPNASVTVSLPFDTALLPRDRVEKRAHVWQLWDGGTHLINCACTFYFLPDLPIAPWDIQSGDDYDPDEPAYPRVEFLDFFTPVQNQPVDFAAWAVQRLNSSGFVYDVLGGGDCHYIDFAQHIFYLSKFLRDLGQPDKVLNCADCAHIVSTACALAGRRLPLVKFIATRGRQWFDCNRIIAIGTPDWRYPFDATGRATDGGFSYHMFNAGDTNLAQDTPLYDACLKVDGGDYPGDGGPAGTQKIETLPTGMPARDGDGDQVNVPTDAPYVKDYYRERLVHDDAFCNFEPNYVEYVASLDVVHTRLDTAPSPFIAAVRETFGLAPTPEQIADFAARPRGNWTLEALPGAALTWSGPDHDRWSLGAGGQVVQVRHWRCGTAEEASWRMAAQVAAYTHPDKRPGRDLGAEVGERRVVVGGRQIVFCRLGHVFTVGAETPDAALAAAKALDESVQTQ